MRSDSHHAMVDGRQVDGCALSSSSFQLPLASCIKNGGNENKSGRDAAGLLKKISSKIERHPKAVTSTTTMSEEERIEAAEAEVSIFN